LSRLKIQAAEHIFTTFLRRGKESFINEIIFYLQKTSIAIYQFARQNLEVSESHYGCQIVMALEQPFVAHLGRKYLQSHAAALALIH